MKLGIKKGYNLQVVLDKLGDVVKITEDGGLSYTGFEVMEYKRLLSKLILFPKSVIHINKDSVTSVALKNCISTNDLTEQNFIKELQSELKVKLAIPDKTYYVLTTINLNCESLSTNVWKIFDCEVKLIKDGFHSFFEGRDKVIEKLNRELIKDSTPFNYTRVEIKVKSRSKNEASRRGLDALNLFRALVCIQMNNINMLAGNSYQPINKIRLGKIHTLHDEDGTAFDYPVHFEPKFKMGTLEKPKDSVIFERNIHYYLESILASNFSQDIEKTLLRYVDALDEYDNNVAVTKLWGALESLVVKEQTNCELMPTRIAARYEDFQFTKQLVMHIKDYRNELIHEGFGDDDSIHRAYHLQRFLSDMLTFYISKNFAFSTLDEANGLLDKISLGEDKLVKELSNIKTALKYITPE